ncbi:MAG: aminoacyl-tRNA hydrolase [Dehalococcoidales bacterium]|jgi:PTH1 family peptidyl-tRNA hydrolase
MKLIVGLGNPGRSYSHNRHNIGFACLNHFARGQGIPFSKKQCRARTGTGEVDGGGVVLARPQTHMNLSGQSVSRLVKKFSLNLGELIVIHDDLDLPLGTIRIRQGGSSGGHKGVESIIAELGSRDFNRIRVGIGRPPVDAAPISEADIISYVLGDFTPDEKQTLRLVIPEVSQAILCLLSEGLEAAMNKHNRPFAKP